MDELERITDGMQVRPGRARIGVATGVRRHESGYLHHGNHENRQTSRSLACE